MSHLNNQFKHPGLVSDNTLHIIGVISNPVRYHSRYRLYRDWHEVMKSTPNVKVYTVEAALGERHFEVTDPLNPNHHQIRVSNGIWLKENMINLGIRHLLPSDWKYVAWVDCDVFFRDPNWAQETIQQLQHYHVVQPWSECLDLDYYGDTMTLFKSFGYYVANKLNYQINPSDPYPYAHSGFAWACTRYFYENIPGNGLLECSILGSADHHMACSMVGKVASSVHGKMSKGFLQACLDWEKKAYAITNGNIGYVRGSRIEHKFHGKKINRGYRSRWQILIDHKFDPLTDIAYDHQGVIQIAGKPQLIEDIHQYNLSRREDSIDAT